MEITVAGLHLRVADLSTLRVDRQRRVLSAAELDRRPFTEDASEQIWVAKKPRS
ncbi:MAG: hypothetical protein ACE5JP_18105 [Candidatus Bipolaricaulia bacterium]